MTLSPARLRTMLMMSLSSGVMAAAACISERAAGPDAGLQACAAELPSEAFGSTIVIIRDFQFIPAQVRVRPGTKVTWVNCGTPGSDSHTSTANAGQWSSPLLPPGATYTREFATAGAFAYHCQPHPGMTGTVTVE
ncbi:MAG: plastocyanin/azurin family copper-binding protein [Gemmatimonadales bacterium]